MVKKMVSFWFVAGALAIWSGPLHGEWPERGLTLVTSTPLTLPWSATEASPQALLLDTLVPRLSRELGVPVTLISRPEGGGVLAAEMVAGARPDGYLFGALGSEPALTRVIQGYTPYVWGEMVPVATGWRVLHAIVTSRDAEAGDLRDVARIGKPMRLAHIGLTPVYSGTLMALEAAKKAGFTWGLERVERMDPAIILEGRAEAMVLPLGYLKYHPQADRFKVITVLTHDDSLPCVAGLPTLESQRLEVAVNPLFAFYVPGKVGWRVRSRLSSAINNALKQPAVLSRLAGDCFTAYREDLEGVGAVLDREYENQADALKALGFLEPK